MIKPLNLELAIAPHGVRSFSVPLIDPFLNGSHSLATASVLPNN